MTAPKPHTQCRSSGSRFPSLKKKTVIRIYLVTGWVMIALIAMTATGVVSYDDVKYFFWAVPFLTAVLYFLYINGKPYHVSTEEGIKSILSLVFTFICLILVFFAAILAGS